MSRIIGACILLALTACATTKQIADQGVKANLAYEDASNQLLLLNVVRSIYRKPMYFSGFQIIHGPIGDGVPSVSLKLPYLSNFRVTGYEIDPSYKPDEPSFDIALLDTQEFMRGITTPIPPATLQYYLDQGWPQELILPLFVREIDFFEDKDGKPVEARSDRIVNYPDDSTQYKAFVDFTDAMTKCELVADSSDSPPKPIGPAIPAAQLYDVKKLAAAKSADLKLQRLTKKDLAKLNRPETDEMYFLVKNDTSIALDIVAKPDARCVPFKSGITRILAGSMDGAKQAGRYAVFRLRSPEAMLYHLGELARLDLHEEPKGPASSPKLFHVRAGPVEGDRADVAVTYADKQFWIPAGERGGMSMHALSLVSQLIALQKKASDLPTTASVRIIP